MHKPKQQLECMGRLNSNGCMAQPMLISLREDLSRHTSSIPASRCGQHPVASSKAGDISPSCFPPISTSKKIKIEASLACANIGNLEAAIRELSNEEIDCFHIDIMDGRFVPNFALDFNVMQTVKELTDIPMDCHLMVEEPERFIDRVVAAGATYITIHFEATRHVQKALQQIRECGVRPGIVLNPATPLTNLEYILDDLELITVMTVNPGFAGQKLIPAMFRKIKDVNVLLGTRGYNCIDIQVDGNVSFKFIPEMIAAGATMLVGGTSSIFNKDYSIAAAIAKMRDLVREATVA